MRSIIASCGQRANRRPSSAPLETLEGMEKFHYGGKKRNDMDKYLKAATDEARKGIGCGGITIGSVLVVGENLTLQGPESYLQDRGVKVEVANSVEYKRLMDEFIAANPILWNEEIGVTNE